MAKRPREDNACFKCNRHGHLVSGLLNGCELTPTFCLRCSHLSPVTHVVAVGRGQPTLQPETCRLGERIRTAKHQLHENIAEPTTRMRIVSACAPCRLLRQTRHMHLTWNAVDLPKPPRAPSGRLPLMRCAPLHRSCKRVRGRREGKRGLHVCASGLDVMFCGVR